MDAFYNLEELEEACTIAWGLQKTSGYKGGYNHKRDFATIARRMA